ncbi:uncharacterized protein BKCO1_1300067 [Diplodia corticola]|uniref:Uncharacterized protein n=1 Tax=Diplodia corticola TaxID=236234 RepID=A0A1J9R689_9PEZI|nr:uncharacterized protein BKCO1_1300067 [Diplodia corticola]OJD36065.1 hypothetical protein BKCO1_1300067 [Diplodia corticola]
MAQNDNHATSASTAVIPYRHRSSSDSTADANNIDSRQVPEHALTPQPQHDIAADRPRPGSPGAAIKQEGPRTTPATTLPRAPRNAAAGLMGLPTEIRQRILGFALSTIPPLHPTNGAYLASLPASRRVRTQAVWDKRGIATLTPTGLDPNSAAAAGPSFDDMERWSYRALGPLYLVNRRLHAEMAWAERAWLGRRGVAERGALSLAGFAAWTAAPTPVDGILTLSVAVSAPKKPGGQLAGGGWNGGHGVRWDCAKHMRLWRAAALLLPPPPPSSSVATRYGIEAVEIVHARCYLERTNFIKDQPMVSMMEMARLQVLLLIRLGLPMQRVRINWEWD